MSETRHSSIDSLPEKYALPALLLLGAGILFYGLGWLPMIGPDEPRYAEVAREMYVSGDWITPRLGGLHWFEKPALTYWLSAAGFALLGVSELASRAGIAVIALLAALLLYFFGKRVRSTRYGYLSAAVLLSSGIWLGFGRAATFDTPLAVTMELALLAFYLWDRDSDNGTKKNVWWFLCCAGLGLAVLAKGLVGIILPGGIIGLYLLLTRRQMKLLQRPLLLVIGAVIFLTVASTWYAPMFARHGQEFWNEFFVNHHFKRYATGKYQHPQPVYFFFAIALLGCLPWSFYLIAAGRDFFQRWRMLLTPQATETDRQQLFLWLWTLLPILFFSPSGSKLPGYILPVFPAVALLIGGRLERLWSSDAASEPRWPAFINGALLLLLGLVLALRGGADLGASSRDLWIIGSIAMAGAVIYLWLFWSNKARVATLFLPLSILGLVIVASHLIFSGIGRQESLRELSWVAVQSARPDEKLICLINTEQSLNFYAPDLLLRETDARIVTPMHQRDIAALLREKQLSSLLVISLERWSWKLIATNLLVGERLAVHERTNRAGDGLDNLVLIRVRLPDAPAISTKNLSAQ